MVDNFTFACNKALCKVCPSRKAKTKYKPPWWSNELDNLKKLCRKDFNEAKVTNSSMSRLNYKAVLSTYKKAIRKAKRVKWAPSCSEIESTTEASRLRKTLAKTNNPIGFIQMPLGNWTISSE